MPLKIVIDYAVGGNHAAPAWMARLLGSALANDGRALAAMAAFSMVLIAALGGIASYVDNYYTESVGQWVANDLRMRVFDHLERLSFTYYDTHQTGLLSARDRDVARCGTSSRRTRWASSSESDTTSACWA